MKRWMRISFLLILFIMVLKLAQSYFQGMFFYPDAEFLDSPQAHGINAEDVFFESRGGRKLNAYFMIPEGPPKGTVIHCHGNAGNISSHFTLSSFFQEAGYQVLCFDYAGYGKSAGHPSPKVIVEDALAAVHYVQSRPDTVKDKLVLFGQSLGGAAAAGAMAQTPEVKALILEGTFTTYRDMAYATTLGRLLFFLTPFVISKRGPAQELPKIKPRPVLIIHGDVDGLIPVKFAYQLFEKASEKKALAILKNFHHLNGPDEHPEYRKRILDFLDQNL